MGRVTALAAGGLVGIAMWIAAPGGTASASTSSAGTGFHSPRHAAAHENDAGPVVDAYEMGSVPPQQVRQGSSLRFQLRAPGAASAVFTYVIDSASSYSRPHGPTALDSTTGMFSYTPAAADKFSFSITFTSTPSIGQPTSQTVAITPFPGRAPEADTIPNISPAPDPTSADYLLVTESRHSTSEFFNATQQPTFDAVVSGKSVVFDPNSALFERLYSRFNNRTDLRSLAIYAETITVRGALKLPGTALDIHAKNVRFEDLSGVASFDTTPLPVLPRAAQFENGREGQKGGDITLFIQSMTSNAPGTRFIADGASGQAAGQGRAGARKPDLVVSAPLPRNAGPGPWSAWWNWGGMTVFPWPFTHTAQGWVYRADGSQLPFAAIPFGGDLAAVYVRSDPPCGGAMGGTARWPEDGEDATPPGVPGTGGAGGNVYSTYVGVASVTRANGGVSGNPGDGQAGGPPQNPVHSAWLRTLMSGDCHVGSFMMTAVHESVAGHPAASRAAAQPNGPAGSFIPVVDQTQIGWLHPNALRMVIAHGKDLYRTGHVSEARAILQPYADLLADPSSWSSDVAPELTLARAEINGLLFRIASNLDYFGHPAGWVPLLSLEATMSAFSGEVDAAVPILFLSQWLQAKARQNVKDVTALQDAMAKLADSSVLVAHDVNASLDALPGLQVQASDISTELDDIQRQLVQRRSELLAKAEADVRERHKVPVWNKALRTVSLVAQMVPIPWVSAAGKGVDLLLTGFDPAHPFDTLRKAPELAGQVKSSNCGNSVQDLKHLFSTVDFHNLGASKETAQQIGSEFGSCANLVKEGTAIWAESAISDDEVRHEFDMVVATDPSFQDLAQKVTEFNVRKQHFAQALADALGMANTGQSRITANLLAVSAMYQDLNSATSQFDHTTVAYIQDMDRRARERLLRFQYYMAKAYEYRMLAPYPGDLNVQTVVDKIVAVMGSHGYGGLSNPADLAAIRSVYIDSLRQIVSAALEQLQTKPPERSLPFFFNLTSAQLQQLNQNGTLDLDIAPLIVGLPNEDNRHIANLKVDDIVVRTSGPLGPAPRVRLVIDHKGESTETLAGHSYQFVFGNEQGDRPFTWGASKTLPNGPLSQEGPSTAGLALLRTALNLDSTTVDALALFARPGADAIVTISRFQNPPGLNATIEKLQFEVDVDFFRSTSAPARLNVASNTGGSPYVAVNKTDVAGRADGVGAFSRRYASGQAVTLTAEPEYGRFAFVEWVDAAGEQLTTSPALQIAVTGDVSVQARYVAAEPSPVSPAISTTPVSGITSTGALTGGTVTSDGGATVTARGVCWSTSANPVTGSTCTSESIGTGAFVSTISGLIPATAYHVRAYATNSAGTGYGDDLTFTTVGVAPSITTHPASLAAAAATVPAFTVVAAGSPAPAIRWQVSIDGGTTWSDAPEAAPYSGTSSTSLHVTAALALNGYRFRAVATNTFGTAISNAATLTIGSAPIFTEHPASRQVMAGAHPTFTVVAQGTPAPTYQWQVSSAHGVSWADITNAPPFSGANTATLTVTSASPGLSGRRFRAVAGNSGGSATSNGAVLIVRTVAVDMDRDGRTDLAIFRPSSGTWFVRSSLTMYATSTVRQWGLTGDVPAPGDYDGDAAMDLAVFRPAEGRWYILASSTDSMATYSLGGRRDLPVPGDYDGDGRTDPAVYDRFTGTWSTLNSSDNYATQSNSPLGVNGDIPVPGDYDGDGRTDYAVYRPSNGSWYVESSNAAATLPGQQWGLSGDVPVPGDYDNDGLTDFAVWRPSTGTWWLRLSGGTDPSIVSYQWGLNGDVPVPADYDGDGSTDLAVWRPSTGTWYLRQSSTAYATSSSFQWGLAGDIPAPNALIAYALAVSSRSLSLANLVPSGDFDGDGHTDLTVYRPSTGTWFTLQSGSAFTTAGVISLGASTDVPVSGDFDGDGMTDAGTFSPTTGVWSIRRSSLGLTTYQWGLTGDVPIPGDYDADGVSDLAVWRPSNGTWFIRQSTTNFTTSVVFQWGVNGDVPIAGDLDGDNVTDLAVWRPSSGTWFIRPSSTGYATSLSYQWGLAGDIPAPGDYDGDGKTDLAVYRPSDGTWFIRSSATGYSTFRSMQWGLAGDVPVPGDLDGDGETDLAVYRPSTGTWFVLKSTSDFTTYVSFAWGLAGDIPILRRP